MKRYVLKDKVLFDWLCANSDDFYEEFQKACAQSFENEYFGFAIFINPPTGGNEQHLLCDFLNFHQTRNNYLYI